MRYARLVLFVVVAFRLSGGQARAQIALGQHTSVSANTGGACAVDTSVTTSSITTSATGSTFVLLIGVTATLNTISDSKSNSYTTIGSNTSAWGVTNIRAYVTNGTGGASHTFTVTTTGGACISIIAIEITGADTTASLDKSAQGNDGATPFDSPDTATLAQANEMLIGYAEDDSNGGTCMYGAGNGFTLVESMTASDRISATSAYKIVASTAGDHASFTDTGCNATQMDVSTDTFKEAAGGAATPCRLGVLGVGCDWAATPMTMLGVDR